MKTHRVYFSESDIRTQNLRKEYANLSKEELIEKLLDLHEDLEDMSYEAMGEDL